MTYTRYLYLAFYTPGMEKTRQGQELYLYHTEKKDISKRQYYLCKVQESFS